MSLQDILAQKRQQQQVTVMQPIQPSPITLAIQEQTIQEESSEIQELQKYIKNSKNPITARIRARQKIAKLQEEQKRNGVESSCLELPPRISLPPSPQVLPVKVVSPLVEKKVTFDLTIQLNEKQLEAVELAKKGKSFVLTGSAGTGKTTTARELARMLLSQGLLSTHDFKVMQEGQPTRRTGPSIAFVAYTRRATNNIRRAIHMDKNLEDKLRYNILTIHSLLEFCPVSFQTEAGNESVRFEPQRTKSNPLGITHLVIEEASMLGTNLGAKLLDALLPGTQIIYMGDINQLQPVMDKPMLSYALVKLPIVELNEIYRQALESDIIRGAHNILKGEADEFLDLIKTSTKKQIKIVGGAKAHTEETLVQGLAQSFDKLYEAGKYDPTQDMILSPFNKNALGTDNINNWIAQFLGKKRNAIVHEVLAGRRKLYLAIGDRAMCNKRDGTITKISINGRYIGRMFQPASPFLSRFGIPIIQEKPSHLTEEMKEEDLFVGYENLDVNSIPTEEKEREASHIIEITYEDETVETINSVGDFAANTFSLGYALTIHKAQGCEWRKVYLVLHPNHAVMLHRELFYTAITRAKEEIQIIAHETTIKKAITNARIKGQSLAEKIEYFNSGALDASTVEVTK
jgi:exodeoxyribonuclease V alpha subunit